MFVKVKDNIKLKDLAKLGFYERTLGVYGNRDFIPEHWFVKIYNIKNKEFYIETNHRYFSDKCDTLNNFHLYKVSKTKYEDKIIPLKGCRKIVRIVIKDLLKMGLVEKVDKGE